MGSYLVKMNLNKTTILVIIPTYYWNEYLMNIFDLLQKQTVRPSEIIVLDQTPENDISKLIKK